MKDNLWSALEENLMLVLTDGLWEEAFGGVWCCIDLISVWQNFLWFPGTQSFIKCIEHRYSWKWHNQINWLRQSPTLIWCRMLLFTVKMSHVERPWLYVYWLFRTVWYLSWKSWKLNYKIKKVNVIIQDNRIQWFLAALHVGSIPKLFPVSGSLNIRSFFFRIL